jgi:CelD/BcsL family acetyltransferase involved in cellulose biosynthesis
MQMELGARRPELQLTEHRGADAFRAVAPQWDALAERVHPGQPFLRHTFLRLWVEAFHPGKLRVLTVTEGGGRLVAALVLRCGTDHQWGMPMRDLSAAANAHSCRFDFLAENPWESGPLVLDHLIATGGWDRLLLRDVPEGGAGEVLFELARRRGLPVGRWESLRSPYFDLPDTMAEMHARLNSRFKANLRRRRRKLAQEGPITLERCEGGPRMAQCLEEGLALEASGWKSKRGSAILQDVATRRFYLSLAAEAAREGTLALYLLRVGERPVAFQFSLQQDRRYFLLKPGYDESLSACSPGQLLMEDVVEDLIGRGVREFDFLGPDMVWKRDWTDRVRVHTWFSIFPPHGWGRLLHATKFRAAPAIKAAMGGWRS